MKFSLFLVGNDFRVLLVALHGNDTLLETIVTMKYGGLRKSLFVHTVVSYLSMCLKCLECPVQTHMESVAFHFSSLPNEGEEGDCSPGLGRSLIESQ